LAQQRPSVYDAIDPSPEEHLSELQEVLFGEYIHHLRAHQQRLDKLEASALESSLAVARSLAQAAKSEPKIKKTLFPVIEDTLRMSVEDNPSLMAGILFPIIGEAVRKAVAQSVQQMMDSTNELLANSFSAERIGWRIEAWRSGRSFAQVALSHSSSYRVEHIYLIHRTTGLLLAQVTNQANLLQDSDMVVGMLTAIQDFVRDSFTSDKKQDLDVIQVGEFKIWLAHGPIALLAAVISGQPKASLRDVLVRQVEHIHRNFQGAMARFETTGQSIDGLEEGLGECLVEETRKPSKPQSYTKFKVAGVVLFTLFCAGTFFYVRNVIQWNDYITKLRRQPGIVVIEDSRNWLTLTVHGLRDPMAMDPHSILADYELAPAKIAEHWEPYYSLDPRFANVRRLNAEAEVLRKMAVRFELDSTKLPIDQLALVDSIGDQIQELAADAARQRRHLHIQLLGHTDRTGSSGHNDALSQQRAEAIVRFLVARGIDPNLLSSTGLGDKQAGNGYGLEDGQDLDRRVTFLVDLR
jgi:outer membrane protein OmpA-like peptidoglycan-associated protein